MLFLKYPLFVDIDALFMFLQKGTMIFINSLIVKDYLKILSEVKPHRAVDVPTHTGNCHNPRQLD